MKSLKKVLGLTMAMAMVLSLAACGSKPAAQQQAAENDAAKAPEKITIRVAHCCGTGAPYDIGAVKFKELVEERSNGRMEVVVHAGDMSTDENEIAEMCQNNNLEVGWIGTGALGGYVDELGIFELPFLFESEDHVNNCLRGEFGNRMLTKLSAVDGITGIGFHEDGWRNILTKDLTVNTVEDMKGAKMRCMQNEVCIAMYEALGTTPVALSSGEQFSGIQNGVVQGTDNSAMYAVADGYIEVVNNICDIHHFYSSGIIVVSSKWYDALSADDQKLVADAAQEAGQYQRAYFLEHDEAYISEYEQKGYTVTRPTDIDAWKEKTSVVYDQMYAKHPTWKDLVETIRNTAK